MRQVSTNIYLLSPADHDLMFEPASSQAAHGMRLKRKGIACLLQKYNISVLYRKKTFDNNGMIILPDQGLHHYLTPALTFFSYFTN
jgi:hypothetical protein